MTESEKALFAVAMTVLRQIASTPRNRGAKRNAKAAIAFIETQSDAVSDKPELPVHVV